MIKTLRKYDAEPFEDPESLLQRAQVIDEFLKEYLRMNPVGDKKYALVSHSMIISAMTSEGTDKSDKIGFKNYTWPENCQLIPYSKI